MKKRRPYSEILKDLEENHKSVPTQKKIEELAEIVNEKNDDQLEEFPVEKIASQAKKEHSGSESNWL
jgi:hypothetical protein